jgi:hypothetical protein
MLWVITEFVERLHHQLDSSRVCCGYLWGIKQLLVYLQHVGLVPKNPSQLPCCRDSKHEADTI